MKQTPEEAARQIVRKYFPNPAIIWADNDGKAFQELLIKTVLEFHSSQQSPLIGIEELNRYDCGEGMNQSEKGEWVKIDDVKHLRQSNTQSGAVKNKCNECSKELENGTVFCSADCRHHYHH